MEMTTKPRNFTSRVVLKEHFTARVFLITLKLLQPKTITFTPGQFINVDIGNGLRRQYSIASSSHKRDEVDLLIDIAPGGPGSIYFSNLEHDDTVSFTAPMGKFGFASQTGTIVFIAAGTGIAPFKSMIDFTAEEQARRKDYDKRNVYVYLCFRHEKDIFLEDYFEHLSEEQPNVHATIVLSQPGPTWTGRSGHVQENMDDKLFSDTTAHFYVCGGTRMVRGVVDYLRTNCVPESRIHFEPF